MTLEGLLKTAGGIQLDIGCGASKQPGWVGMDLQDLPGVDIRHDFNIHPWPLPDECALKAMASHVLEHIPKVMLTERGTRFPLIEFMDEVWRILKPDGLFFLALPHGASPGFMQDPTHAAQINETTFAYFDPLMYGGELYKFYRPKPWKIHTDRKGEQFLHYDFTGNIEVVLQKRREDASYAHA